jgi:uncharacterized protein (TIGR00297 family)
MRRWLFSALTAIVVASLAYSRRTLTADGAVAAAVVGTITFARGGLSAACALLAFFTTSSGVSRLAARRKAELPLAQAKGAQRDAWQVLANGGIATVCVALGRPDGMLGALSAAAADTWATELGVLAGRPPRLITTLRSVPAGTSGGVTPEGLLASAAGALVVGASQLPFAPHQDLIRKAVTSGIAGSVFDSLLGATIQASYVCPTCGQVTEQSIHRVCGSPTKLKRGLRWITNDTVNALATFAGAVMAMR